MSTIPAWSSVLRERHRISMDCLYGNKLPTERLRPQWKSVQFQSPGCATFDRDEHEPQ